jgi:hypothetical protein
MAELKFLRKAVAVLAGTAYLQRNVLLMFVQTKKMQMDISKLINRNLGEVQIHWSKF